MHISQPFVSRSNRISLSRETLRHLSTISPPRPPAPGRDGADAQIIGVDSLDNGCAVVSEATCCTNRCGSDTNTCTNIKPDNF